MSDHADETCLPEEGRQSTPAWVAARRIVHPLVLHCSGHVDHFGSHCSQCVDATQRVVDAVEAEREACASAMRECLDIASLLEVKGPYADEGTAWLHLRPDHKRNYGFVGITLVEPAMIAAYASWFARLKTARDAIRSRTAMEKADG